MLQVMENERERLVVILAGIAEQGMDSLPAEAKGNMAGMYAPTSTSPTTP